MLSKLFINPNLLHIFFIFLKRNIRIPSFHDNAFTICNLDSGAKMPGCQSTFCSPEPQNILGSSSELHATVCAFYLWNCCSNLCNPCRWWWHWARMSEKEWMTLLFYRSGHIGVPLWMSQIWPKMMQYDYWISIIEYWIEILWLNIEWWPRWSCEQHDCLSRNVSKQHNKDSWLCYPGTFMYG